jgi:peptide chain release factor 1
MLEKLNKIISRYEDLRNQALQPEVFQNPDKAKVINKELSGLEDTYNIAIRYKKALEAQTSAEEMLKSEQDTEMLEMAQEELDQAKEAIEKADQDLTVALLPKDPNDDKNIYLEIRPAA